MKRNTNQCEKCSRNISLSNFEKHINVCAGPVVKKIYGVDYDPNAGYKDGTRRAWNLGLTKETDDRIKKSSETLRKFIKENGAVWDGRKHTEETKQKLSEIRIKFLRENPDKVPYKLNHYSKGPSYPEKYWKEVFDNNNVVYIEQYQISTYQLDFAIIDKKIDIEIDGEQHYVDDRIIRSDKRRNQFLINEGWEIIRIRWAKYIKLNYDARQEYVNDVIKQIR